MGKNTTLEFYMKLSQCLWSKWNPSNHKDKNRAEQPPLEFTSHRVELRHSRESATVHQAMTFHTRLTEH